MTLILGGKTRVYVRGIPTPPEQRLRRTKFFGNATFEGEFLYEGEMNQNREPDGFGKLICVHTGREIASGSWFLGQPIGSLTIHAPTYKETITFVQEFRSAGHLTGIAYQKIGNSSGIAYKEAKRGFIHP